MRVGTWALGPSEVAVPPLSLALRIPSGDTRGSVVVLVGVWGLGLGSSGSLTIFHLPFLHELQSFNNLKSEKRELGEQRCNSLN